MIYLAVTPVAGAGATSWQAGEPVFFPEWGYGPKWERHGILPSKAQAKDIVHGAKSSSTNASEAMRLQNVNLRSTREQ